MKDFLDAMNHIGLSVIIFDEDGPHTMSHDPTEPIRRHMLETGQPYIDLEATPADERLTTAQLMEQYEVLGFLAPFVHVRRRSDGIEGTLEFTHSPRLYFNFKEHKS